MVGQIYQNYKKRSSALTQNTDNFLFESFIHTNFFLFSWTKSLRYQYFNINIQFFVSDISFHCLLFESITQRDTCNSKKVMKKIATNTMFTIGYTENQRTTTVFSDYLGDL